MGGALATPRKESEVTEQDSAAQLAAWMKLIGDVGPLPGEELVVDDEDLREWAIEHGLARLTDLEGSTVVLAADALILVEGKKPDPNKFLRIAAHSVLCRARPYGTSGQGFTISGSALRRLERALEAADAAAREG